MDLAFKERGVHAGKTSVGFVSTHMCYGLNFVFQNLYIEALKPIPQKVTIFGDRAFKEANELK